MLNPEEVRSVRVARGISMAEIAEMVGMSKNAYGDFENGKTKSLRTQNEKRLLELMESRKANNQNVEQSGASSRKTRLLSLIAKDLRSAADFIGDADVPNELKTRKFVDTVTALFEGLDDYVRELERTE